MENAPAPTRSWRNALPRLDLFRLVRLGLLVLAAVWLWRNWHEDLALEQLAARYGGPEARFVHIDGLNLHYRSTGEGPAILLLHDAHSSLHTWDGWAAALSDRYRVIRVDLPGFGLTGPHPQGSYSAFMYTSFVDSLAEKLSLKKFHLAGNGLGAQIAWQYAAENTARRVDRLILLDAPGFEEKNTPWTQVLAKTPLVNRVFWKITPRAFVELLLEDNYANDALVTDSLVQRHFDLLLRPGNRRALTDRASVSDNRPPADMVEGIKVPTLILWGAEDRLLSPEQAYEFHRRIRNSSLKIYRNTGHWPQEENPVQTAADVRAFLEDKF